MANMTLNTTNAKNLVLFLKILSKKAPELNLWFELDIIFDSLDVVCNEKCPEEESASPPTYFSS
jgi:hypothetical protein